jgi:hypothetical protein
MMPDVFTHALELIAQVMRDDSANCLNRNHRRWQSYGFHLAMAAYHLHPLMTAGMGKPQPPELDALAHAAILTNLLPTSQSATTWHGWPHGFV